VLKILLVNLFGIFGHEQIIGAVAANQRRPSFPDCSAEEMRRDLAAAKRYRVG
jgi:hypothetical protein